MIADGAGILKGFYNLTEHQIFLSGSVTAKFSLGTYSDCGIVEVAVSGVPYQIVLCQSVA